MSPSSYQTAPPRNNKGAYYRGPKISGQPLRATLSERQVFSDSKKTPDIGGFEMVPKRGLEPPRGFPHYPLKIACLPIPPLRQGMRTLPQVLTLFLEPPTSTIQFFRYQVPQGHHSGRFLQPSQFAAYPRSGLQSSALVQHKRDQSLLKKMQSRSK